MTNQEIIQEIKEVSEMKKERHTITIAFPMKLTISQLFDKDLKINSLIFETEDINYFQDLQSKLVQAAVVIRDYIDSRNKSNLTGLKS